MSSYKYEYLPSSNYSSRTNFADYNGVIDTLMLHHWGIDGQRHSTPVNWLRGKNGGNENSGSSAHYVVSSGLVTGLVPEASAAWHCVGRNGSTIGIELRPEMSKGDWNTAVELCCDIEERRGSMRYDMHQNNAATACPGRWAKQIGKLIKDINAEHRRRGNNPADPRRKSSSAPAAKPKPKPAKPKPKPRPKSTKYTGASLVDYLNSVGRSSSYSARARLAKQYGIINYRGTARQNTQLLNKLRGGVSSSKQSSAKSVSTLATEAIRGDHGDGHAQRRRSMGISAAKYKQVRAEVNKRYRGR